MNTRSISTKELKLTAAVYAKLKSVVDTVKQTGKLPETINPGGMHIGANLIIRERGEDITLSEDEQLIFDAIVREHRLPGGSVVLLSEYSHEQKEKKKHKQAKI